MNEIMSDPSSYGGDNNSESEYSQGDKQCSMLVEDSIRHAVDKMATKKQPLLPEVQRSYNYYKQHYPNAPRQEEKREVPCVLLRNPSKQTEYGGLNHPGFPKPSFDFVSSLGSVTGISTGPCSLDKLLHTPTAMSTVLSSIDEVMYFRKKPVYSRPYWPFYPWGALNIVTSRPDKEYFELELPDSFKIARSPILPSVFELDISAAELRGSPYEYFIEKLYAESHVLNSEEITYIKSAIEAIMVTLLKSLGTRYKLFKNSLLLKMGSIYEDTKFGVPDEFDFMIEIPELQNEDILEILEDSYENHIKVKAGKFEYRNSEVRVITVKNREYFSDIFETQDEKNDRDDKAFLRSLWMKIHNHIATMMKSVLLEGWEWVDAVPGYNSTFALTQKIIWHGKEFPNLVINIDICLSIPRNIYECASDSDKFDRHILLRSDGTTRYTYAVREVGVWKCFESSNGRKVVYRALKRLISTCIPKGYKDDVFRMDSSAPSYWMKTIMFYLFEHYKNESHWLEAELPLRVLEAMLLLEKCLDQKELSSFFVPHNVLKNFAWQSKIQELYVILQNVTKINTLLLECCRGNDSDLKKIYDLQNKIQSDNETCREEGLFKSLIEILYMYAYNDYLTSTMKSTYNFVSLFLNGTVELRGEGKGLQVFRRGELIDLNQAIDQQYDDQTKYFDSVG